jgi:hypothetical protein
MSKVVASGATLKCNQGTQTAKLTVLPILGVESDGEPTASVDDYVPMVNVPSFGMCQTEANPQVAAATAAAQGVLTPQPCIPAISTAWSPGSDGVLVGTKKALTKDSTCSCSWSGTIEVNDPADANVTADS